MSYETALVTGGNSGIGRATAIKLADQGLHVIISGRDQGRGAAAVDIIRSRGGRADFIGAALQSEADARALATRALALTDNRVDVLINNAASFAFGPTENTTEDQFDQAYGLGVKVPYFLVAALAPQMAQRGIGSIVNVTTMVASFGMRYMALYGSTKAALNLLTKAWAAEYGPAGVRVNAVSPGPTRTEGTDAMGGNLDALVGPAPAGRPATPAEIADGIIYLATGASTFVHGVILPVDGGRLAV
jgi:NAD(P)-dependent dehydrogenase (short-subunit alcohol dehydrogenase family)